MACFKALLIEKVSNAYNKSEGIKRKVADNFDIDVRQSKVGWTLLTFMIAISKNDHLEMLYSISKSDTLWKKSNTFLMNCNFQASWSRKEKSLQPRVGKNWMEISQCEPLDS